MNVVIRLKTAQVIRGFERFIFNVLLLARDPYSLEFNHRMHFSCNGQEFMQKMTVCILLLFCQEKFSCLVEFLIHFWMVLKSFICGWLRPMRGHWSMNTKGFHQRNNTFGTYQPIRDNYFPAETKSPVMRHVNTKMILIVGLVVWCFRVRNFFPKC